jgi:hypothetical protein
LVPFDFFWSCTGRQKQVEEEEEKEEDRMKPAQEMRGHSDGRTDGRRKLWARNDAGVIEGGSSSSRLA